MMKILAIIISLILLSEGIYPFDSSEKCCIDPSIFYFADSWAGIRHLEGDGVGFNQGYSTLELFLAAQNFNCILPFLNLRGHVFNDGRYAANVGGGVRKWSESMCGILGVNFFYDFRETKHRSYHQTGAGLEFLGECFDYRLNGYLPISRHKSKLFDSEFDSFTGNNILLNSRFEYAMAGFDAEIGSHFFTRFFKCLDLYPAVGFYYFNGERGRSDAIGGRIRLEAHFNRYFYLEGGGTFDSLFHARGYGQIAINLPLGNMFRKKACSSCCCKPCRGYFQPIYRDEIIVLDRAHRKTIATSSGVPIDIIFVNNANPSAGNGTFEDPFMMLASAEAASTPGDIIYVFSGDGASTNMDNGIILKDSQSFLGSGVAHTVSTNLGLITIPALTSNLPLITNGAGNVITLASDNVISGFQIFNPAGAGIFGSGFNNTLITNNVFSSIQDGIRLLNPSGQINIVSNQLEGSLTNPFAGIHIDTFGTTAVSINVNDNNISTFFRGVQIYSFDSSDIHSIISGNTLLDNVATGIDAEANNASTHTTVISNNHIDSTIEKGILVFSNLTSILNALISGNVLSNNGLEGVAIGTDNGGTVSADVNANIFLNNGGFGGLFAQTTAMTSDHICLRLIDNMSNTGYFLQNETGSTFSLEPPVNNTGTITTSGVIISVPPNTCATP